jgi:hypothetical protein
VVQWVAQTPKGDVVRVLMRNGQAIPESEQHRSIEAFIHDPNAQARKRQAGQRHDKEAADLLKLLPVAFVWTETGRSDETTTYHFKPGSRSIASDSPADIADYGIPHPYRGTCADLQDHIGK